MIKNTISIYDCLYGYIYFSNLAHVIIDKPEFQRLRYIKQLSTCNLVFPTATHSRFEHSLGTYHITGLFVSNLIKNSQKYEIEEPLKNIRELDRYYNNYTKSYDMDKIIELIKIAGLCHDIGHGPYSHLFDDYLKNRLYSKIKDHEYRSELIIERIILDDEFLKSNLLKTDIEFIKRLINPNENNNDYIYQIISNSKNGLDVDKFDYLTRDAYHLGMKLEFQYTDLIDCAIVINNNICFPNNKFNNIISMYEDRKKLHKIYLNNPIVLSSQFLITDILNEINNEINLIDRINDIDFFIKLTDDFIINFVNNCSIFNYNLVNNKLFELNNKFLNREFIKHTKTIYSDNKLDNLEIKNNEYIYKTYFGYINKVNNPLNNITLFDNSNNTRIINNHLYDNDHITYANIIYNVN